MLTGIIRGGDGRVKKKLDSGKDLTCLRESPIIVTPVRARVMIISGAEETPSAGLLRSVEKFFDPPSAGEVRNQKRRNQEPERGTREIGGDATTTRKPLGFHSLYGLYL